MTKTFTFRRNDGTTFTVEARDAAQATVKAQVQHDQAEADKRTAAKAAKAFNTVKAFHAALGPVTPCGWDAYRAEMVTTYGVDGATLDAMARLGHFHTTPDTVAFYG